jgi:hypothetical protein
VRRNLTILFALIGWAYLAAPSRADIVYQYVTDQSNYTVSAGATFTVNLYLKEFLSSGDTSFITAESGMLGAGVGIQRSGSGPTIITAIKVNDSTIGSGGGFGSNTFPFDQTNVNSNGRDAALIESIAAGTPQGPTPDAQGMILLGTATLKAGAAGTTTTFTITSFANSSNTLAQNFGEGNTVTVGLYSASGKPFDLDSTDNKFNGGGATYMGANDTINRFTVTVPVVPEPGSLILGGAAALVMGLIVVRLRWGV